MYGVLVRDGDTPKPKSNQEAYLSFEQQESIYLILTTPGVVRTIMFFSYIHIESIPRIILKVIGIPS